MPEINITEEGKKLFDVEIAAMEAVKNALDERFEKIVKLICDCKGKVVITGMGKPGHIGTKIAATIGKPRYTVVSSPRRSSAWRLGYDLIRTML